MSQESQKHYLDEIELPENLVKEIDRVAEGRRLNASQKEKLEEEVKKRYMEEVFEPGNAVGIISAQSISEPATQMTMRSYHIAGAAGIKVTHGLPRLVEIFDARRSPKAPMMTIYLKKEYNNEKNAKKIADMLIEKTVLDLTKQVSLNLSKLTIEIELIDERKAKDVVGVLENEFKNMVKKQSGKIIVSPKDEVDVKELQGIKEMVMKTHVSGIKGISNAVLRRGFDEWFISTLGSNLKEVLVMKEIDVRRTVTNDIHETVKVLGIEAGRNLIISEALKTLQEQGLDVDTRHIMLVGDIMTFSGDIQPIGRYGVAGAKKSVLARAAFEETIKHLVKASVRNEVDRFQGIFENVMIGRVVPSGTGMFDLIAKFEEEKK